MQKMLMQLTGWSEDKRKVYRVICPYCHEFHSNDELVENLCPKMTQFVKGIQDKHSYICTDCFGEGSFQKKIETKIYETKKKYQKRLQAWKQKGEVSQKPQRKMLNEEKIEQVIQCQKCKGKGRIYRVYYKKTNNSRESSIELNASWLEQKMKGQTCEEGFKCIICMEESQVTYLTLNCSHSFHLKCIYKWLKTNDRCPICRNVDPFIDLKLVPSELKADRQQVQRGNRNLQLQRRNFINIQPNESHPRVVDFGFEYQYSEADW